MSPKKINAIFKRFQQNNPEPKGELHYTTAFELLIAVILSAQATDIGVNKATDLLFPIANTPEAILQLGSKGLEKYIKTIGLYNSKGKHILKTCEILINQFDSKVPNNRKDLETLPGVGRKTANVVLNIAFGESTIAVDTHIFRISNRIGFAAAKTPLEVEKQLLNIIPESYQRHAHHWLILHGRYICKARKPLCSTCPINDLCEYPNKEV